MLMNYPSKHLLLRRKGKLLEHSNSLKGFRNILTAAVVSQRRCLPVESLQFLMRMEMLLLVICMMRRARRCGALVIWRTAPHGPPMHPRRDMRNPPEKQRRPQRQTPPPARAQRIRRKALRLPKLQRARRALRLRLKLRMQPQLKRLKTQILQHGPDRWTTLRETMRTLCFPTAPRELCLSGLQGTANGPNSPAPLSEQFLGGSYGYFD